MDIRNSHIKGDLTISNNTGTGDSGSLNTNLMSSFNTGEINISQSDLKITNLAPKITFENNGLQKAEITYSSTGNLSVLNNTGNISIYSAGSKGIDISQTTGDVLFTGSLATIQGDTIINKGLTVDKQLTANDGLHQLINTSPGESVLEIKSTSILGKSAIDVKNSSGAVKLQIGYGNSLVASPLTDQAFITSVSGSLLFRGDSTDSFLINTDGSVNFLNTAPATTSNNSSVSFLGGVGISNTTDASSIYNGGALTVSGGASIEKSLFIGNTLTIKKNAGPSNPGINDTTFYIDTLDTLFKSKNNTGTITIYQPTNTKGDLTVHNGTTQVRLPVGSDGQTIVADSLSPTGVAWGNSIGPGSSNAITYYLISTLYTFYVQKAVGAYTNFASPNIDNGASSIMFSCKSFPSLNGVSIKLNQNPSLISNLNFDTTWPIFKGIKMRKNYTEADGEYSVFTNEKYAYTTINLTGTSWSNLTQTTGAYFLSIYTVNGGPCAHFLLTKNVITQNTGNIVRILSSPGTAGCLLEARWPTDTQIQVRKTNNNNDTNYRIVDNLSTPRTAMLILTGTTSSFLSAEVFNHYQNRSFVLKITSTIIGAPCAVFLCSKNNYAISANSSFVRSPGLNTGELLSLEWNPSSLPSIKKSGNAYDGTYDIALQEFFM